MPSSTPRYVYLLTRLRGRQITMEEATELFALQQSMIRRSAPRATPPPPIRPDGSTPAPPGSGPPPMVFGAMTDDGFALGLLALGAGAGVLAAVLKRSALGPRDASGPR